MSNSSKEASKKEQEDRQDDSVFDFLYNDTRRVGAFLAQLDPSGYLDKIVQREAVIKGRRRGFKVSLGGGASVVGTGGQGSIALERGPSDEGTESLERFYDPLWANARALLDYLDERDLIKRSLERARIGQFVLVGGQIMLLDLAMLRGAWEKAPIQHLLRSGFQQNQEESRQSRRARSIKSNPSKAPDQIDIMVSLLSLLPHSIQARMIGENVNVWCGLDAESIVGNAGDLILKHGSLIGGEWFMLGILDATPYDPDYKNDDGEDEAEIFAKIAGTGIGQLAARLGPVARGTMGRPSSAFGLTPLLIFRDVNNDSDN